MSQGILDLPKMVAVVGGAVLAVGLSLFLLTGKPKQLAGYRKRRRKA